MPPCEAARTTLGLLAMNAWDVVVRTLGQPLLGLPAQQVLPALPPASLAAHCLCMQGVAPGGGEDPYHDAGRMGGTLSHLAREHPPTGA
jgi:hypothetical protein